LPRRQSRPHKCKSMDKRGPGVGRYFNYRPPLGSVLRAARSHGLRCYSITKITKQWPNGTIFLTKSRGPIETDSSWPPLYDPCTRKAVVRHAGGRRRRQGSCARALFALWCQTSPKSPTAPPSNTHPKPRWRRRRNPSHCRVGDDPVLILSTVQQDYGRGMM
jgi:hypothetical protein